MELDNVRREPPEDEEIGEDADDYREDSESTEDKGLISSHLQLLCTVVTSSQLYIIYHSISYAGRRH